MLVLSRRVGEVVLIDGGRVRLVVQRISGGKVYLAFEADRDVLIDCEEFRRTRAAGEGGGDARQ